MIPSMGDGNEITGGDAGPATSGNSGNISAGFSGGFKVGDYFARGSQVKKTEPFSNMFLIAGAVLVAFWLLKKKK